MVRRYDAGTRQDKDGRVVGHYCGGQEVCFHCKDYPFEYPRDWTIVSDKTMDALATRARAQITEAVAVLGAIDIEMVTRVES